MVRGTGRSLESDRRRRWIKRLLLAGVAVGVPVAAGALLRRRAEPPSAPRWGRAHRYAGRSGPEVVFQELGSGPPVLLLHSFGPGYDANQWRAAAEILAGRHRVYVPDLPGWGRTRAGAGAHYPELYMDVLADFLAGVVREKAVVVAAGLAAAYAVQIAVEHPERVKALGLVSPLGLGGDDPARSVAQSFLGKLLSVPLLSASVLDALTGRAAVEHHLRKEVYAAPERVDAALLEHHYRASHTRGGRAALAAYLRGDLWLNVSQELAQLEVPVWLAWGRQSKTPPVATADLWLQHLPGAELDVFEGAGALPHAEASALFCRGLERFLDKAGE
ncbi:MAG TPA: alpha/beta fold hydrolase [Thermoanaerobaculia bacterium]|jgi:pimeloyl-ACP methyl ester carboxylesterase|nr:alpha/beta fold hydrolase [Thermoanaerobaculia bacterium]